MLALGESTSFSNTHLFIKLKHTKSNRSVTTECVELDKIFLFSLKKFYLTHISDKLMLVNFAVTVLLNRNKLMGVITKISSL